jgi:hypothetical protein
MLMRALVGCSLATGALAFLPAPHLPAAVARAPVRSAPVMSSLFMEENSVADRIKDGLLIRYLPEVRTAAPCAAMLFATRARPSSHASASPPPFCQVQPVSCASKFVTTLPTTMPGKILPHTPPKGCTQPCGSCCSCCTQPALTHSTPQDIYRVLNSWDRMVENKPFEDKVGSWP